MTKILIPKNSINMKGVKAPGGMSNPVAFRMPKDVYDKLDVLTNESILTKSQVISYILSSVIDKVELREIEFK